MTSALRFVFDRGQPTAVRLQESVDKLEFTVYGDLLCNACRDAIDARSVFRSAFRVLRMTNVDVEAVNLIDERVA